MRRSRMGKIGVYGCKTRKLQRCLSFEAFGLSHKEAHVYLYKGDARDLNNHEDNLGSRVFFEVPDRVYCEHPKIVPIGMEPMHESSADFSRFGLINPLGDENTFRMHIDDFDTLGREPMVGDVFEIPFHTKNDRKALWEITDVDFKSEMEKFIVIIKASPLKASRKNESLSGIVNRTNDEFLMDMEDDQHVFWEEEVPTQDLSYDKGDVLEPEPTDYRNKGQADFLDDPFKSF